MRNVLKPTNEAEAAMLSPSVSNVIIVYNRTSPIGALKCLRRALKNDPGSMLLWFTVNSNCELSVRVDRFEVNRLMTRLTRNTEINRLLLTPCVTLQVVELMSLNRNDGRVTRMKHEMLMKTKLLTKATSTTVCGTAWCGLWALLARASIVLKLRNEQ